MHSYMFNKFICIYYTFNKTFNKFIFVINSNIYLLIFYKLNTPFLIHYRHNYVHFFLYLYADTLIHYIHLMYSNAFIYIHTAFNTYNTHYNTFFQQIKVVITNKKSFVILMHLKFEIEFLQI